MPSENPKTDNPSPANESKDRVLRHFQAVEPGKEKQIDRKD
jgi:hypothetical protein